MRSAKTLDFMLTVVMHTSLFVVRSPFHHPSPQIFFSGLFRDRTQATRLLPTPNLLAAVGANH
ncbi:hypothetical protein VD0004_g588 [Verticillium dahliae]|nr:hypothetical protein VD0004_g588 [Verticillium dahliae]PNH77034.1 hypothetical protein VD0001_g599 [Verticillium dahliae]